MSQSPPAVGFQTFRADFSKSLWENVGPFSNGDDGVFSHGAESGRFGRPFMSPYTRAFSLG